MESEFFGLRARVIHAPRRDACAADDHGQRSSFGGGRGDLPRHEGPDTQDGSCDADCSLREAFDAANANAGSDTISVPAGSYVLTHALGMLSVTDDVDIEGSGETSTFFDGDDSVRVLDIASGVVATLSDLSIRNGRDATAAGIRSDGDLTLTKVSVAHHGFFSPYDACCRAVRSSGTSTLHDSHASRNGTGGITNLGTLMVNNGKLSHNGNDLGAVESGAGLLNAPVATAVLNDTVPRRNVGVEGGGIYNQGAVTLNRSTISGSEAQSSCSAIYNSGTSDAGGITYATLGGWSLGILTTLRPTTVALWFAFLAGSMVVGVFEEELPGDAEGRFLPFLGGALCFAALSVSLD